MSAENVLVLVVDDNEMNRDMLSRRLERQGYRAVVAEDGQQALELLPTQPFDLMLLDIMMPRLNGYDVLQRVKNDPALRHIPIIMISAVDDLDSVVKCVEMGADDYLFKPFNPILLKARVSASLEKKRLRDQEQTYLRQMQSGRSADPRLAGLPPFVAERLRNGETAVVDSFNNVTALVAGVIGLAEFSSPIEMVDLLNRLFAEFDRLAEQNGIYRVKATGNIYMLAGGIPAQAEEQAQAMGQIALDMQGVMRNLRAESGEPVGLQIGMHTGPVVGGVIQAMSYLHYDLWGEAVNTATRLQSEARLDDTLVSPATYALLRPYYHFEDAEDARGERIYRLKSRR
jgi:adenylate cyclase